MTVALHETGVTGEGVVQYLPETYGRGTMRLIEWAKEAEAAHHLAQALVKTPFAGSWKNDPDGAAAAILKGAEVGLTPVTALGSFDNIQGTPAPKAITLRALVQSHGHEVILVDSTETKCVIKGKRRGSSEWQTVTWTIERAHRLKISGKDNWQKQPQAMLMARATSEICRLVGSDVILGIGYSTEELADDDPEPTTRTRRRATVEVVPMPEPDLTPQTDSGTKDAPGTNRDETVPESPYLNTSSGLARRMFALFNEVGITDKERRLERVTEIIGRLVTTSKEMTDADAQRVIAALEADLAAPFPDAEPGFEGQP